MALVDSNQSLHLRLRSCIQTVLEIHEILDPAEVMPDLAERFADLKEVLLHLEALAITEADVTRVELATNHLLKELKPILQAHQKAEVPDRDLH